MQKNNRYFLLTILSLGFCYAASAKITLLPMFGDNMVLQQKYNDAVWGWASPGSGLQ